MRIGNHQLPVHPIWVVCSESHYSTFFASKQGGAKPLTKQLSGDFDLLYFDGCVLFLSCDVMLMLGTW